MLLTLGSNLSLVISSALAGILFTATVPWEAPNIGTYVLYLVQIVKIIIIIIKQRREKV